MLHSLPWWKVYLFIWLRRTRPE